MSTYPRALSCSDTSINPPIQKDANVPAILCGLISILSSSLGLIGIYLNFPLFSSFLPGYKIIAYSSALGWIVLGLFIVIGSLVPVRGLLRTIFTIILLLFLLFYGTEALAGMAGGHTTVENAINLALNTVFPYSSTPISPIAATLIGLFAIVLLCLLYQEKLRNISPKIPAFMGTFSFILIIPCFTLLMSYFYGSPFLYGSPIAPVAVPALISALFTGMALVCYGQGEGMPVSFMIGPSVRAELLRNFLPLTLFVVLLISMLQVIVDKYYDIQNMYLLAVYLTLFLIITGFVVIRVSEQISSKIEDEKLKRKAVEDALNVKNQELMVAYEEITSSEEELRDSYDELKEKETDLIRIMDELTWSENKFHSLFETMGEGVALHEVIRDSRERIINYRIIDMNQAYEHHTGIPIPDAKGRLATEVYKTDPAPYLEQYASVADSGVSISFETFFPPLNKYFLISAFSPEKGKFATIFLDITERKQADLIREKLIGELEVKNAELERFTYMVSHDLKSPLITIEGFLGYLERDVMNNDLPKISDDIRRIRNATGKMSNLLKDLLELSRIGRVVSPSSIIPMKDLAEEASELISGRLETGGIRITISPDLPEVFGDRTRLLEVLTNLIENATKFMGDQKEPHIEVGIKQGTETEIFYVSDNGIGIEPGYQEKIFGLFEKLDPKSDGTGIGLAIVKRIVELHGGKIWVISTPGKGSEFCFTLRKAMTDENDAEKESDHDE